MRGSRRPDVIWLLSGQMPDHSMIAAFVSNHGNMLNRLFRTEQVAAGD